MKIDLILRQSLLQASAFTFLLQAATPALAAGTPPGAPTATPVACEKDMSFEAWLSGLRQEALSTGISANTWSMVAPSLTYDASIIAKDRQQSVFQQSFLQFSERMASNYRIVRARKLLKSNQEMFARIETEFGVPAEVIVAFWALESDFGAVTGKFPILSALTSLAYDCRRPDFFRPQLLDAIRIVQRGDLKPSEMIGNWAGELGGTQFTPTDYFKYAVDYDHDGKADLVHSVPDTLASSANFLKNLGWHRGEPWIQEVQVPANLPWQEADVNIQHPLSQWEAWGVKPAYGNLPTTNLQASLLLPMGRLGPAFLAFPSFQAFMGWNSAMVYSTTAAYLALRIDGAPVVGHGNGTVQILTTEQMIELQNQLNAHGYNVGPADGKLGSATRAAIRLTQMKLGLPADSYPTVELISKLQQSR